MKIINFDRQSKRKGWVFCGYCINNKTINYFNTPNKIRLITFVQRQPILRGNSFQRSFWAGEKCTKKLKSGDTYQNYGCKRMFAWNVEKWSNYLLYSEFNCWTNLNFISPCINEQQPSFWVLNKLSWMYYRSFILKANRTLYYAGPNIVLTDRPFDELPTFSADSSPLLWLMWAYN